MLSSTVHPRVSVRMFRTEVATSLYPSEVLDLLGWGTKSLIPKAAASALLVTAAEQIDH